MAHFGHGQWVAFFAQVADAGLAQAVCREHGADFSGGVGLAHLDVAELAVGVGDQVVEQFVHLQAGRLAFDGGFLPQGEEVAAVHGCGQLQHQATTAVAVFFFAVEQNALERGRSSVGFGPDVFFNLQIGAQLQINTGVVGDAADGFALTFSAAANAFGIVHQLVFSPHGGQHFECEGVVGLLERRAVQKAVELIVALGLAVADFGLAIEDFIKDDFGHHTADFGGRNLD